jgi:hypothetical protein
MFFVGATGHLLTLILTVCLPVVFLFSAKPSTIVSNDVAVSGHHQISTESPNVNFSQADVEFLALAENNQINIHPEIHVILKIPLVTNDGSSPQFHFQSSGNKAPPVFHC